METTKKVCINCKTEFEPKKIGSHEQIYCSKICRYSANNQRRADKIMNLENRLNEQQNTTRNAASPNILQAQPNHTDIPFFGTASHSSLNPYSLIEKQYDAKVEALEYKLRSEELERRYKQLEYENIRLQSQLDEYENQEPEEDNTGGFIGQILQNDMIKQTLPLVLAKFLK
jgi:hypothetical protein